jgi:hypothetical protein
MKAAELAEKGISKQDILPAMSAVTRGDFAHRPVYASSIQFFKRRSSRDFRSLLNLSLSKALWRKASAPVP